MQLVIDKYGTSLSIKNGLFFIRFKEGVKEVPVTKVESILLNRSTKVTGEAIAMAVKYDIDMVFVERSGQPFARIWSSKFGSVSTIRKNQLAFSQSNEGVEWIRKILTQKIDNQSALLIALNKPDYSTERLINDAVAKMSNYKTKIKKMEIVLLKEAAGSLRGWEGSAARYYFQCINLHLPEQFKFEKRSKRPALDMFNCLLNYAYGILYNSIESMLIKSGIDPYIGIFHRDEYNRPVLVYDVIELYRVWAEFVVIDLCRQQVVFKEFFDVQPNKSWYLNANGKRILIQAFNDYMDEQIQLDRLNRSRLNHIRRFTENFAQHLKTFKTLKS